MPLKDLFRSKKTNADAPDVAGDDSTLGQSGAASLNEKAPATDVAHQSADQPAEQNDLEKRIEGLQTDTEQQEKVYPKKGKLALITAALCLSVFCMALDNTIIATAIPRITDDFKSFDDVAWYGASYLLTTSATCLLYGKLYTYLNIKWVYICALAIFEIGSAICGAAPNSPAFIIGRAIAGVGTGGIFSGAILIIANTVPLSQRPTYTGMVGGMYGLASVAGPLLGGAFTDSSATWRWCFYINLPIGAITLVFIFFFYNPTERARTFEDHTFMGRLRPFDLPGTFVFLPMIVCLLLALQWGGSTYPWSDGRIIALLVVFGVLLIVFITIQFIKGDNGTVPPRVISQRTTWAASFFALCLGGAFFVFVYYVPLWFQGEKGTTAVQSGIDNLPLILSLVIASMVGGVIVTLVGYYTPFIWLSSILMSIGAGLMTTWTLDTGTGSWIGFQIIFGFGVGFGLQQALIAVQAALPEADVPVGTALIMFSQTLGGALMLGVGQNIFTNKLLTYLARDVPEIDPSVVLVSGATSLVTNVPEQYLYAVRVAYNSALVNCFQVGLAIACISALGAVFVEWKSVKGKKLEMAAA